jgi:integrase
METSEKRFRFNKTSIAAVTCPPDKAKKRVYDTEIPGLSLLVTCNGSRTYYLYRFLNGRPMEVRIDTADRITPEQARERARELNGQIVEGRDPQREKVEKRLEAQRAVATLGDLWEAYRSEYLIHKKPVTQREFKRVYKSHLSKLEDRPLAEITKDECRLLHKRIGTTAPYMANRVLALLSAIFREKGNEFGLPEDWTPTQGIKRFPERARDRVLSPEELGALLRAIDADENELVRDYFRMMLYTGSRRGKLAEMNWQHISFQRRTWTVPGTLMKNNAPLVVNLVDEAIEILKRRERDNPTDSPFVFPARALTPTQVKEIRLRGSQGLSTRAIAQALAVSQSSVMRALDRSYKAEEPRPFNGAAKAWERILNRAGISQRTTPHDLRRTYVTNLLESGAALMHVAAAVGHRSMETTQKHYSVARQDKVADAVRVGVATMLKAAEAAQETAKSESKIA